MTFTSRLLINSKFRKFPNSFSLRNNRNLPAVRDQGRHDTCLYHAVIESLEYGARVKNIVSEQLSIQHYIDAKARTDEDLFNWLVSHGVTLERLYPYEGIRGRDRFIAGIMPAFCATKVDYFLGREIKKIMRAIRKHGPVVAIFQVKTDYPGDDERQVYKHRGRNIYERDDEGRKQALNHAILLTGWIKLGNRVVWKYMNSWGSHWGNGGFGLIVARALSVCISVRV